MLKKQCLSGRALSEEQNRVLQSQPPDWYLPHNVRYFPAAWFQSEIQFLTHMA